MTSWRPPCVSSAPQVTTHSVGVGEQLAARPYPHTMGRRVLTVDLLGKKTIYVSLLEPSFVGTVSSFYSCCIKR